MKGRMAAVIVVSSMAVGGTVGGLLIPRFASAHGHAGAPSSAPSVEISLGPFGRSLLLSNAAVEEATGLTGLSAHSIGGSLPITACTGETTLAAVDGHAPVVAAQWPIGVAGTLEEKVIQLPSVERATAILGRLAALQQPCQQDTGGHWTYDLPTRSVPADGIDTIYWLQWNGRSDVSSGPTPMTGDPCGGLAVFRTGTRVGILEWEGANSCINFDRPPAMGTRAFVELAARTAIAGALPQGADPYAAQQSPTGGHA